MKSVNEFGLSKQEIQEAESLLASHKIILDFEAEKLRNVNNIVEQLLGCYGKVFEINSNVADYLGLISKYVERFKDILEKTPKGRKPDFLDLEEELGKMANNKKQNICFALPRLMIASAIGGLSVPPLLEDVYSIGSVFKKNQDKLVEVCERFRNFQKFVRCNIENEGKFDALRNAVHSAIKTWAEFSENRIEYLESRGFHFNNFYRKIVNINPPTPIVSSSQHPVVGEKSRWRKKKQVQVVDGGNNKHQEASKLKCSWEILAINPVSGNVERIFFVSFDDINSEKRLRDALSLHINNQLNISAAIRQIKNLLEISPESRSNKKTARVLGMVWYKLKVGQHRVLVHIKDTEQAIFVMAGRWKKLYGSLKIGKSEK